MREEWRTRLARWKNYRYAALVVLLGVVLMLLPSASEEQSAPNEGETWEAEAFDRAAVQSEMEKILSAIEGVGALRLMLTVDGDGARTLAESSTASRGGTEEWQEKREPLVISRGSGTQEVVVTGSSAPRYVGALVVCEGADSASVRLAVTEAVAVLTALPSDRITVVQGKP